MISSLQKSSIRNQFIDNILAKINKLTQIVNHAEVCEIYF